MTTTDCCDPVPPVFQIDSEVRLKVTITDPSTGFVFDPATVAVFIMDPTGVITTPAVTRLSTGVYICLLTADQVGQWGYKFKATGPDITSPDQSFFVQQSIFPAA